MPTEAERRDSMRQSIANARIDGFEPDAEFLTLAERLIRDEITHEEAIVLILEQCHVEDRAGRPIQ